MNTQQRWTGDSRRFRPQGVRDVAVATVVFGGLLATALFLASARTAPTPTESDETDGPGDEPNEPTEPGGASSPGAGLTSAPPAPASDRARAVAGVVLVGALLTLTAIGMRFGSPRLAGRRAARR